MGRKKATRGQRIETVAEAELEAYRGEDEVGEYVLLAIPRPSWELPTVLSPAEREIATLVLAGLSSREVARTRGTSLRTVQNQVRAIYEKLEVGSRAELAARCAPGNSRG